MASRRDLQITSFGSQARKYFADILAEPNTLPALFIDRILSGEGKIFGYAPNDLLEENSLNFHFSLASNRKSQKLTGFGGGFARIVSVFCHLLERKSERISLCSDVTSFTKQMMQHGGPDPKGPLFLVYGSEFYTLITNSVNKETEVAEAIRFTGQLWHSMFLIVESKPLPSNRPGIVLATHTDLEELARRAVVLAIEAWDGEEFLYWVPEASRDELLQALHMFISVPEIGN
jgi:hypothetical protein